MKYTAEEVHKAWTEVKDQSARVLMKVARAALAGRQISDLDRAEVERLDVIEHSLAEVWDRLTRGRS